MPSARKKVTSTIARARSLHAMFDKAGIGVAFLHLRDRKFAYANPVFCDIVGYSHEELRSMTPMDLTHSDDRGTDVASFEQLVGGDIRKRVVEKRYVRKDGNLVWLRLKMTIVQVASVPLAFTVVEDISERKIAEMRLADSESRLRKSNEAKDVFLASLAHELRNPLAAIRNSVEVMRRLQIEDGRLHAITGILERQSQQLSRLVDDLLDTSRVRTGKVSLDWQSVLLSEVVEGTVEGIRPVLQSRSQTLHLDIAQEALWVRADVVRLTQVFTNLLDNASKYSPEGARIGVTVHRRAGEARVLIEDSGDGISEEHLPHIFELFAQGTNPGRHSRGLGIGLTIVKRLVELHHGRITVTSVVGSGTAVEVALPIDQSQHASSPMERYEVRELSAVQPMRILVIDDNADSAVSLSMCLQMSGHSVRTASNGHEALKVARRFKPDVSLLDIDLPGMRGYELARQLKSATGTAQTMVVALTGHADTGSGIDADSVEFAHRLLKPVTTAQLDSVLKGMVRT